MLAAVAVVLVSVVSAQASKQGSGANVAEATKLAQAIMKPVTFKAPGPPIPVGTSLKGKTVKFIAPVDNQFSETAGKAMQAAGAVAGVSVQTDFAAATLSQIQAAVNSAIVEKVSAIVILSVPPAAIAQPIKDAISHGIPVMVTGAHEPGALDSTEKSLGVKADVTGCYSCAGRAMADFAVMQSKGNVHALFINSPDIGVSNDEAKAFASELKRLCSTCTTQQVDVPVADWATQMTSTVASALAAHPDINYIAPVFDTMEAFTTPAVKAANALNKINMVSFNASEAQMKEMQTGAKPTWVADGGYDLTWWGWLMMDDVYRAMLNKPTVPSPAVPLRFFTKASVKSFNLSGSQDPWYGNPQYVSGFKKLWGITS
jgi:ribose transport system substrate-binding protein